MHIIIRVCWVLGCSLLESAPWDARQGSKQRGEKAHLFACLPVAFEELDGSLLAAHHHTTANEEASKNNGRLQACTHTNTQTGWLIDRPPLPNTTPYRHPSNDARQRLAPAAALHGGALCQGKSAVETAGLIRSFEALARPFPHTPTAQRAVVIVEGGAVESTGRPCDGVY